jgi:putative membrane protein
MYNSWNAGIPTGMLWFFVWVLFWCMIPILMHRARGRGYGRWDHSMHTSVTPLDILKERYAKGEIDKKEFEQKKKDLLN